MSGIPELGDFRRRQTPPLSLAGFGKLIGVDRATVFRWETGTRKPDEKNLPKIMEVTGLPAHVLRPDLVARAALFVEAAE